MPDYKLTYFNVIGLGEPIRFLLSYGGADFEEIRINGGDSEEWKKLKPHTPFGQIPMLEIEGKVYAQTLPICRYLAKRYNLLGKTDLDVLQIDAVANSLHDLRKQVAAIYREKDPEKKAKLRNEIVPTVVYPHLARYEKMVENNGGYFHGGELSYADIFFAAISDSVSNVSEFEITEDNPNLKALKEKVLALPGIKEWVAKRPKLFF